MTEFYQTLLFQLKNDLEETQKQEPQRKGIYQRKELVDKAIADCKKYKAEHPFADIATEMYYFRHVAPFLYGQSHYLTKIWEINFDKEFGGKDKFEARLSHEL